MQEIRNQKKKSLAANVGAFLFCFLLLFTLTAVKSEAASCQKKTILANRSGYFYGDFNGDGRSDTVCIKTVGSDAYSIDQVMVLFNNRKVLNINTKYRCSVETAAFQCAGKKKYLYLQIIGDDDDNAYASVYSFQGKSGKVKTEISFKQFLNGYPGSKIVDKLHWFVQLKSVSNSGIKFTYSIQLIETGMIQYTNSFSYKNNAFKYNSTAIKVDKILGHRGSTYQAARTLNFYTKPGGGSKSFTLKKGQKVKLKKIWMKSKGIFIACQYGSKTGYLKVGNSYASLHPQSNPSNGTTSSYFTNIYLAG